MNQHFYALIAALLCLTTTTAQMNAPWDKGQTRQSEQTFEQIQHNFETYWEDHDPKAKGSGFKQFKRWEYYWQYRLTPDGKLPNAADLDRVHQLKASPQTRASLSWKSKGPFSHKVNGSWSPGTGRVNVIVPSPSNARHIYVGTPAGGLWKSTDDGKTWQSKTDHLASPGVSGIAIDHKYTQHIYISTGDRDGFNSFGTGIYKSTNGGNSWKKVLTFGNQFTNGGVMAISPSNHKLVLAATTEGLYRSTDAGSKWKKTIDANIIDLKFHPSNPSIVYATGERNGRCQFYKSTNSGNSFKKVTSGLPAKATRMMLGVSKADSKRVYLLAYDAQLGENNGFRGLYRSNSAGEGFYNLHVKSDLFESTIGWYCLSIGVSQTNANTIFTGVLNMWKSTDGGKTFKRHNSWSDHQDQKYTHADIHFIAYYGNRLYAGTDGGIYRSTNNGGKFEDLSKGLNIGQYYSIATSENKPAFIVGGLQDNGGYFYNGSSWTNFMGADGMASIIDPSNPNKVYTFTQNGGSFHGSTDGGRTFKNMGHAPQGETGSWVTPAVGDKDGSLLVGYSELYRWKNGKWTKISNMKKGLLTQIELDPKNSNNVYVAVDKVLYSSSNGGRSFKEIKTFQYPITSIEVNNDYSSVMYVTLGGYNFDQKRMKVYRASGFGKTWTNITPGLPDLPAFSIRHLKGSKGVLYLGNASGVYKYTNSTKKWNRVSTGLPNTPVYDVELDSRNRTIKVGTYGRGVWESKLPSSDFKSNKKELCTSKGSNSKYMYINKVELNKQAYTTGNNGGYKDQTSKRIYPYAGGSFDLTIRPGFESTKYKVNYRAYVDWNKDGDFEDANETVMKKGPVNFSVKGKVQVPNVREGVYTMRVVMAFEGDAIGPCGSYEHGETEDYTVRVKTRTAEFSTEEQTPSSMHALQANNFTVYPNPANQAINILPASGDATEIEAVEVYNLQGALLLQQEQLPTGKIDVSELPNQTCILVIHTRSGHDTQTILIQH